MATALERASSQRKFAYFGLIALIFTFSMFWRGVIDPPSQQLAAMTIARQAEDLELRELSQGEADLTGAAIRLSLFGSRGLVMSALWWSANEKQKKHEWNELELIVRSITKLQPHFITPWLFQSWNISYNVSVESERLNDMYFYISRGIELLAEGERLNKRSPDLRYWIGFYYQNKFGVSDKVITLRSLFQLSCIPPAERNPQDFWDNEEKREVNLARFRAFCEKNPQLVRRLKESSLNCTTPAEVVDFLAANAKIPSRYDERGMLADITKQFPILPARFSDEEADPTQPLTDSYDPFMAARAWFRYAQEPLPPPTGEPQGVITDYDRKKYKIPRSPATILFRQGPPRAQSYIAERLEKEGWFDALGWKVDSNISERWFPSEDLTIGTGVKWAEDAWSKAFSMWSTHGDANGLRLTEERRLSYELKAKVLLDRFGITLDNPTPELRPDQLADPEVKAAVDAHAKLIAFRQNQQITNYEFFYLQSQAEQQRDTIEARKWIFEANRLRKQLDLVDALKAYQTAFELWKRQLEANPKYHFHHLERIQEEIFRWQMDYLDLLRQQNGPAVRDALFQMQALLGANSLLPGGYAIPMHCWGWSVALQEKDAVSARQSLVPYMFVGPFDGLTPTSRLPWVSETVKQRVRADRGEAKPVNPVLPGEN